jgi:hypothetical protein
MGFPGIAARFDNQPCGHALIVFEQCLRQMRGGDLLVAHPDCDGLGRLQKALGAVGEFLKVHRFILFRLGVL